MSERLRRVDELLRAEISAVLARDVDDPRIGFVTITRIEASPDLSHALVWASVIGPPAERRRTLRALAGAMPFVRGRLGALHLKRIPELEVREDDTAQRGTRVLEILDELEAGHEPGPPPSGETLPTPLGLRGRAEPPDRSSRPARRRRDRPATARRPR